MWSLSFVLSFHPMSFQRTLLVITIMTLWKLLYLELPKHSFYFMWPKYTSYHNAMMLLWWSGGHIALRLYIYIYIYIRTTQVSLVFSLIFARVSSSVHLTYCLNPLWSGGNKRPYILVCTYLQLKISSTKRLKAKNLFYMYNILLPPDFKGLNY